MYPIGIVKLLTGVKTMAAKEQYSDSDYANRETIAKMFGFSPKTLDRWRCEKRNFPYYIIGGAVRYNIEEVRAIVQGGRVNAGGVR